MVAATHNPQSSPEEQAGRWCRHYHARQPAILARRILFMEHVVSVALDAGTLKQLDDLRRAHPNVPNRTQIIQRLIWDAHARIAQPAEEESKNPA
jgi:hypothetical protein